MKIIPLGRQADVRFAQMLANQFGLNATDDVVVQLADKFAAFRHEREQQLAALKAEFDRDVAELRAELERTRAEMEVLRALNARLRDTA